MSVGEAGTPHSDVLQQPEVLHLMAAALLLQQQRGLDIIGLDAANIVGFLKRATGGHFFFHVFFTFDVLLVLLF